MNAAATTGLGVPTKTLVTVFAIMGLLFGGVAFLSKEYAATRLQRAKQYFQRGEQLVQQGRDEQAVQQYRNALLIAHDSEPYRLALAKTLLRLGRLEESSIYLREILRADPGDAIPNLLLARIAARENHAEPALNYYHRAIFGYWPEDPEDNRLEARWELIGLLQKTGSRNQILAELLEIADQAPNDLELKQRVARRLLENDSPNQAAELFHDVVRQQPRNADALAGYGEAQFALGRYVSAQAYLRRAVRAQPENSQAKGELDQADQILALDPMLRGLSLAERYARSRTLAGRTLAALDACLAKQKTPPPDVAQFADGARKQLASRRRPRVSDATEINISLAEDLWAARGNLCGAENGSQPVLARVMANLSR